MRNITNHAHNLHYVTRHIYMVAIIYMATIYMRQPVGHMPGASSTTSIWRMLHRSPPKHWPGSALSAIEDEIRGKPVELRLSVRQARARPLLDELRKWMEKALRSLSSKSETAAAIR
jgi:hypothetical protein